MFWSKDKEEYVCDCESNEYMAEKIEAILNHLGLRFEPAVMEVKFEDAKLVPIAKESKPKKKRKAKKEVSWYDSTPFDTPVKKRGRPRKSK